MNVLRVKVRDIYSVLTRINRQTNKFYIRSASRASSRRNSLLAEMAMNRMAIQEILLFARYYLQRIFSQTFQHAFALFRLALDHVLFVYSAVTPTRRQFAWQQGFHALDVSKRVVKTIVKLVVGLPSLPVTFPIPEVPLPYFLDNPLQAKSIPAEIFKELAFRLDYEIGIGRGLAREFSWAGHRRRPKESRTNITLIAGEWSPFLHEFSPFLIDQLFITRGWQIKGKQSRYHPLSAGSPFPHWGRRYLVWLNKTMTGNTTKLTLEGLRKEARVLYRIIRWNPRGSRNNSAFAATLGVDINRLEREAPVTIFQGRHFFNPNQRQGEIVEIIGHWVNENRIEGFFPRFRWCFACRTPPEVITRWRQVQDILLWANKHHGWPLLKTRQIWGRLPAPDSEYYQDYFGFDPRNKILLDPFGRNFYYEAEFPPHK